MPATPRPFRPSIDDKRATLTSHLLQVIEPILRAGTRYADLSVEQIIKAGGIARSTFYEYYDDKGALLGAMADDVLDELFSAGESWWSFPDDGDKAGLRAALLPAIETHQRHQTVFGAVAEAASYDDRVRERRARLIDEVVRDLAAHIRRAQKAHSANPGTDPERTAKWLIVMIDAGLYALVAPAGGREMKKLLDALTDIVWRTLYEGYRAA